jgi:hypothetical protein
MIIISPGCSDCSFKCKDVSTAACLVIVVNNMSSEYATHCFSFVDKIASQEHVSQYCIYYYAKYCGSGSPSFAIDSNADSSVKSLFTLIVILLFVAVSAISLINFDGTLYCLRQPDILS